ncbi:2-phospho-L-lactate guanylyltransferase [soil metagenome]
MAGVPRAYHAPVPDPAPASLSSLHAIVPVRGLGDGKERLGPALDAEEREALVLGMLLETLAVLQAVPGVARVHVVSRDETLLRLAARDGAALLGEDRPGDLNSALRSGRESALADGATAVLYLPADLPLVSVPALTALLDAADAALAAGQGAPAVVVAPADVGGGTNALLLCPPGVIEPSFGPGSLAAHLRAVAEAGASLQLVLEPALGFDLDTPEDLERLEAAQLLALIERGATALSGSGIA